MHGDGAPDIVGGSSSPSTSTMALVDISHTQLESLGLSDGKLHDLKSGKFVLAIGPSYPGGVKVWIDDIFIAVANTTGSNNRLEGGGMG